MAMNEELKSKIEEMVSSISSINTKEGIAKVDELFQEARNLAKTPEEKNEAGAYLRELVMSRKKKRNDVDIKNLLSQCQDFINLSYIAKYYFNHDKSWLYQRINGAIVNGKPAAFTENELKILADSLKEISLIISDTSSLIKNSL